MEKILMLKGQSKYNVLRIFMDYMKEAFEQLGYTVVLIDGGDQSQLDNEFQEAINEQYKFVFTFNGVMSELKIEKDSLYNLMNTTYVTFIVDHPLYHKKRLIHNINKYVITCVDKDHIQYVNKFANCVGFLPHGGCKPKNIILYDDRKYNLVFMGSYHNPDKLWKELCDQAGDIGIAIAELWKNNIDLTFEEAIREFIKRNNTYISDLEIVNLMGEIRAVDRYIRAYYRDLVIRKIISAKIQIEVFGTGWNDFLCEQNDYIIKNENIDFYQSLELMGNSKIVLNVIGSFKNGAHERIFSSMLANSVCLTDRTKYLEEVFEDGKSIVLYDLKKLDDLPKKIQQVLEDNSMAKIIANNGRNISKQEHQWTNRAKSVIELVEKYS